MKRCLTGALLCALLLLAGHSAVAEQNAVAEQKRFNGPSAQEVTIGVAYPAASLKGETHFEDGLSMAVADANAAGGVLGKPMALLIRDDKDDTTLATQIAQSFIDQGIEAVIGHWSTNVSYMVEDVYDDAHVVMITPNASGGSLYDYRYEYIFRMISTNLEYVEAIADYARTKGYQNFAIYYSDDVYGRNFANTVETAFAHKGLTVIDRVNSLTEVNLSRVSDRWRAYGCDGVVIGAAMPEAADAIRHVRMMPEPYRIFGADTLSQHSVVPSIGGDVNNIYHATYDAFKYDADFVRRFEETYGEAPDFYAVNAYQCVMLLRDAMEATGSQEGEAIAEYIRALKDYKTISATLSYNEKTQEFDGQPLVVVPLSGQ